MLSRITAAVSAASSTLADFKCDFKAAQERQEYTQGACMAAQHDFKKHSARFITMVMLTHVESVCDALQSFVQNLIVS